MSELANTLDLVVRNALLQSTAIFLVGLLLARFAVRRPARVHTVLVLAFLAAIVAPLASEAVRRGGWGLLPPEPDSATTPGKIAVRAINTNVEHAAPSGRRRSHTMPGEARPIRPWSTAIGPPIASPTRTEHRETTTAHGRRSQWSSPTIVADAARTPSQHKTRWSDGRPVVVRCQHTACLAVGSRRRRRSACCANCHACDEPAVRGRAGRGTRSAGPEQRPRRRLPIQRRALSDDLVLVGAPQGVAAAGRRAHLVGRRVDAHSLSRIGALETARSLVRAHRGSRVLLDALAAARLVVQAPAGARQRTSLRRLDRGGRAIRRPTTPKRCWDSSRKPIRRWRWRPCAAARDWPAAFSTFSVRRCRTRD